MLKDGLCAGYLAPFEEMLCFFSSFVVLFDLQTQKAAQREVMPRRDVFPHTSLHFPFPAGVFLLDWVTSAVLPQVELTV